MVITRFLISLAVSFVLIAGNAFAKPPAKILKIQDIKSGTKAIGFSVFEGIEPMPFDVVLSEPTEQLFTNLILARISGGPMETPLEKLGAISGMSGSPIFINCAKTVKMTDAEKLSDCVDNGTLVGSLSYRIGDFPEGGVNSMITPAEYMLGARSGGYAVASMFADLPLKISYDGKEFANLMLSPKIDSASDSVGTSSKCANSSGHMLKPGSMVSIYLAWGDISIPASGTVTWVDDENIYVFGHQLNGVGRITLPFKHVSVATTRQSPQKPNKIPGCYLETSGVMTVDGTYEVAGVIGGSAPMLPFRVDLSAMGQTVSLNEEVANSPMAQLIITQLPYLWAQSILGSIDNLSIAYQVRMPIDGEPEIFFKNIIPAKAFLSPFKELFGRIDNVLFKNLKPFGLLNTIEKIQVKINLISDLRVWATKASFLSQEAACPGETVYINVILEEISSRAIKQISIPIKIPTDYQDRIKLGHTLAIDVSVQSGSRFVDKNHDYKTVYTPENFIRELNTSMNRDNSVLYIQEVRLRSKTDIEGNNQLLKLSGESPGEWRDLAPAEFGRLPSSDNLEIILTTTSPLSSYIDFDKTFSIAVKPLEVAVSGITAVSVPPVKKSGRKWFWLFLH